VQAVSQKQDAFGNVGQDLADSVHLGLGRIGREMEDRRKTSEKIVTSGQAAGQNGGPYRPEYLEPVSDGIQPGTVHNPDPRKPLLEKTQFLGKTRGRLRVNAFGKGLVEGSEEFPGQVPRTLEESLRRCRDMRPMGIFSRGRFLQGLLERPGCPENHRRPKLRHRVQGPQALALGGPRTLKYRFAQTLRDMRLQNPRRLQEIDLDFSEILPLGQFSGGSALLFRSASGHRISLLEVFYVLRQLLLSSSLALWKN